MQILDNLIIICLVALSFFAGVRLADKYHREEKQQVEREVRLAQARMLANDYAPYVAPVKRMPIGARFEERLRTNKRATQQISPEKPIS